MAGGVGAGQAVPAAGLVTPKVGALLAAVLGLTTLGTVLFAGRGESDPELELALASTGGASQVDRSASEGAASEAAVRASPAGLPAVGSSLGSVTYARLAPEQAEALTRGLRALFPGGQVGPLTQADVDLLSRISGLSAAELTPILAQMMATGVLVVEAPASSGAGVAAAGVQARPAPSGKSEVVAGIQERAQGGITQVTRLPRTGLPLYEAIALGGAVLSAGVALRKRG